MPGTAATACARVVAAALVAAVTTLLWLGMPPAQAFKGGHFEGTVNLEPTSRVGFDLVKRKKKIGPHRWRRTTRIKRVVFEQALAGCGAGGISPIAATFPGTAKLKKKGRFVLKAKSPGRYLFVSGSFVKRFRGAYGEFHLTGPFPVDGLAQSCDTGPRGWQAQRTSYSGSQRR